MPAWRNASFADRLMVECLEPAVQLASLTYVAATLIFNEVHLLHIYRRRILVASVRSKVSSCISGVPSPRAQARMDEADAHVCGAPLLRLFANTR